MAGLFQPIVEGPQGSSVTPVSPAPVNPVNVQATTVGALGGLAVAAYSLYEKGEEKKKEVAQAKVVTSFTDEISRINEAVDSGQINPTEGRSRARAIFNKYSAANPLALNDFLEVQKKFGESQMGKALMTGGEEYQKQKAAEQQALQDGFTNVDDWKMWQTNKQAWEVRDQARKEVMFKLDVQAKQASISASESTAILNRKKALEVENKMHQNTGLREDLSGRLVGAQATMQAIINSPLELKDKVAAIQQASNTIKGNLASTYTQADQANLSMAMSQVESIQKWAEDAVTKGKETTGLKNSLDIVTNSRALEMLGNDKFKNLAALNSVFGQGLMQILPNAGTDVVKSMIDLVVKPKDEGGKSVIPPPITKPVAEAVDSHIKTQVKAEEDPLHELPKKEVLQNQVVNTLRSLTIYGDEVSSSEDVKAASKLIYGGAYDALKSQGGFDVPSSVQEKYKGLVYKNFEEAMADIKMQYLDSAVQDYSYNYSGTSKVPEVSGGSQPSAKIIIPTVENGVFKFVPKEGSSSAATAKVAELNRKLAPAINNLAKMVAVANGDPDLNKALKELAPRLFEEQQ